MSSKTQKLTEQPSYEIGSDPNGCVLCLININWKKNQDPSDYIQHDSGKMKLQCSGMHCAE